MLPIKVVIADDHTLFREGLKWIFSFEKEVTVVGEASNGPDVAKIVEDAEPDVLLLDVEMPDRDKSSRPCRKCARKVHKQEY